LGTVVIKVIIPAFNEENAVGKVIGDIPKDQVSEVIVVNNASTDLTEKTARALGATVLNEPQKGYGNACLKGIRYLANHETKPDVVVFLDADYSDYPEELPMLVEPIAKGTHDLVIGSRTLGERDTDLGPFRAVRYSSLIQLNMQDKTYGWTVEMQLKAVQKHLRYMEIPVNYRVRTGKSKISGTVRGTIMAGYKILWTIFKYL
jgi:glycosyltransferase involved in cell wall biosynthesis